MPESAGPATQHLRKPHVDHAGPVTEPGSIGRSSRSSKENSGEPGTGECDRARRIERRGEQSHDRPGQERKAACTQIECG